MKSFRVVRSQSHTSTDRRRSLSDAFSLLNVDTKRKKSQYVKTEVLILFSWIVNNYINLNYIYKVLVNVKHAQDTTVDSQGEGLVPAGVEGGTDGPGLLFGLILRVGGELEFNIGV